MFVFVMVMNAPTVESPFGVSKCAVLVRLKAS